MLFRFKLLSIAHFVACNSPVSATDNRYSFCLANERKLVSFLLFCFVLLGFFLGGGGVFCCWLFFFWGGGGRVFACLFVYVLIAMVVGTVSLRHFWPLLRIPVSHCSPRKGTYALYSVFQQSPKGFNGNSGSFGLIEHRSFPTWEDGASALLSTTPLFLRQSVLWCFGLWMFRKLPTTLHTSALSSCTSCDVCCSFHRKRHGQGCQFTVVFVSLKQCMGVCQSGQPIPLYFVFFYPYEKRMDQRNQSGPLAGLGV